MNLNMYVYRCVPFMGCYLRMHLACVYMCNVMCVWKKIHLSVLYMCMCVCMQDIPECVKE